MLAIEGRLAIDPDSGEVYFKDAETGHTRLIIGSLLKSKLEEIKRRDHSIITVYPGRGIQIEIND